MLPKISTSHILIKKERHLYISHYLKSQNKSKPIYLSLNFYVFFPHFVVVFYVFFVCFTFPCLIDVWKVPKCSLVSIVSSRFSLSFPFVGTEALRIYAISTLSTGSFWHNWNHLPKKDNKQNPLCEPLSMCYSSFLLYYFLFITESQPLNTP